ncbi:MAG TPA: alpha/beta fold hydrolase [Solirubrobacteraceae bacterium]|nr:alpha/beta fold hydrolase [Solirubrobacteraceae bacterium]
MSVPIIVATAIPAEPTAPEEPETLVLGPSLGTTTAVWNRARRYLTPWHPLLVWDLPGHGSSPATTDPFTILDLAEGVLRAADAADLDTFAYAGISLGGVAGLQLALRWPDRVSRLALICSLPKIGTAEGWLQRAADVRAMGTPSLVTGAGGRWFTPGFLEREPEVAARVLHDLLDVDDESYALCVDALRETDLRDAMAGLAMPFTLIVGDSDPVISIDEAQAVVESAPDGALHVVHDASHMAAVEHPAKVAGILIAPDVGGTP